MPKDGDLSVYVKLPLRTRFVRDSYPCASLSAGVAVAGLLVLARSVRLLSCPCLVLNTLQNGGRS